MKLKLLKEFCGYLPGAEIGVSGRRGRLLVAAGIGVSLDPIEPDPEPQPEPKIETADSKKAKGRAKAVRKA